MEATIQLFKDMWRHAIELLKLKLDEIRLMFVKHSPSKMINGVESDNFKLRLRLKLLYNNLKSKYHRFKFTIARKKFIKRIKKEI